MTTRCKQCGEVFEYNPTIWVFCEPVFCGYCSVRVCRFCNSVLSNKYKCGCGKKHNAYRGSICKFCRRMARKYQHQFKVSLTLPQ